MSACGVAGYALYLVPLAVLWLLNLRWLLQLTSKTLHCGAVDCKSQRE